MVKETVMNEEATVVFKSRTHVLSSYVKIDYRVKSSGTLIVKWTSYPWACV
jgi:hypothetical protein